MPTNILLSLLGSSSGILCGYSYIPYLRDIFKKTTKPERASWLIWSVLGSIAFFSQLSEGASWSLGLTVVDTIGVLLIFCLSLKFGVGGLTKKDIIALITASVGLFLWYLTRHAIIALLFTILIDISGTILTVIKAYKDPASETLSTWLIIALSAVLAIFAVGKFDVILLIYPFYIFLANFSVAIALFLGKKVLKKK